MENMRKLKGMSIAKEHTIKQVKGGWIVPSQNSAKNYFVSEHDFECDCPDCQTRKLTCKHGFAVKYFLGIEKMDKQGKITTEKVRLSYKQAWHAYNQAQTAEVKQFEILLADLLESIEEPAYKFGRPTLSLREQLFCSIKKVYSQMSSRRAKGLFDEAKEKALIEKSPYYNCVSALLNKEDTTALLEKLITLSALPLKAVEHTWLIDSSGFRTTQFTEYCQIKHGRTKEHKWIKAHIVCGAKTNVISSAKVTEGTANDCPQFQPLMQNTHDAGFEIATAIGDKAYLSRDNFSLIDSFGGTPLVPFKSNTTGKPKGKSHIWRKMYSYFMLNQEEFYQRYFARNNVESTFHMIKMKLGDSVKSKKFTAQKNELLCKIVAHNLMVLINEVYTLGIAPQFEPFKEKEVIENLPVK